MKAEKLSLNVAQAKDRLHRLHQSLERAAVECFGSAFR